MQGYKYILEGEIPSPDRRADVKLYENICRALLLMLEHRELLTKEQCAQCMKILRI